MRYSQEGSSFENLSGLVQGIAQEFLCLPGFVSAIGSFVRALCGRGAELIPDAGDGLSIEMGGEALASGDGVSAKGQIETDVRDLGNISIAVGEAQFDAVAVGDRNDPIYANADVFANVEGADFIFIYSVDSSLDFNRKSGSASGDSAYLKVIAIDIENFDLAGGPIEIFRDRNMPWRGEGGHGDFLPDRGFSLAEVAANAHASGDAAYTFAGTDSFAADSFAVVDGYAYGAIA